MDELTPENSVEETSATEIMRATWRLRRSLDELRKLQKGRFQTCRPPNPHNPNSPPETS
jgi:hypothetical protein